ADEDSGGGWSLEDGGDYAILPNFGDNADERGSVIAGDEYCQRGNGIDFNGGSDRRGGGKCAGREEPDRATGSGRIISGAGPGDAGGGGGIKPAGEGVAADCGYGGAADEPGSGPGGATGRAFDFVFGGGGDWIFGVG